MTDRYIRISNILLCTDTSNSKGIYSVNVN